MRKKMEESGREFAWNDSENAILMTQEQRDAAARAAVVGGDGSVASGSALYKSCVIATESEAKFDILAKLFEHKSEPYSANISQQQLDAIDQRICVGDVCLGCDKCGVMWGSHLTSVVHNKTRMWHASCDNLMGPTTGARPYCIGFHAKAGILDEECLVQFWGSDVMHMESAAKAIIRQRGIKVKPSKNKPGFIVNGKEDVLGVKLAFVEFKCQQGKYDGGKSKLRWPHQLPCKVPVPKDPALTWWPVVAISFAEEMKSRIQTWIDAGAAELNMDEHMLSGTTTRKSSWVSPSLRHASSQA